MTALQQLALDMAQATTVSIDDVVDAFEATYAEFAVEVAGSQSNPSDPRLPPAGVTAGMGLPFVGRLSKLSRQTQTDAKGSQWPITPKPGKSMPP